MAATASGPLGRTGAPPLWSRGPTRGVGLDAVGPYRITNPGPGGLIFGYATVSERAIAEGVARLAR
jgi:hypothetical protein